MKKVNLILQSKGGVGKSLFTWFVCQNHLDKDTMFIDLDKSTRTSSRLTKYINPDRVLQLDILDESSKMERDKLMNMFQNISETDFENWVIDMGAPESDEFKKLLQFDYSADIIAEELSILGIDLNLFVVISGNDAMDACFNYFNSLKELCDKHIKIIALMNEGTFGGALSIDVGRKYFEKLKINFKPFGNLGQSESGKEVIKTIAQNNDPAKMSLAAKMIYRKAVAIVKDIL